MIRIGLIRFLMFCGLILAVAQPAIADDSAPATSKRKSAYDAFADIVSQDKNQSDISRKYLAIPLVPKGWMVVPPGLARPPAVGAMVHEGSTGVVHFFIFPVSGKDGVGENVIAMYLGMQESGAKVDPVKIDEAGSWAMFTFASENGEGRGKVFGRALSSAPGYMVIGLGQWDPAKHEAYVGDLDRMVAAAHLADAEE